MIMRGNRDPRTTSPHHVFDYKLQAEAASPAAAFTDKFHIINSRDIELKAKLTCMQIIASNN